MRVDRKRKNHLEIFCKRTLDKGFERDWSVGLGAMLGDGHTENEKNIFLVSGIFQGKIDSVMLWFRNFYKTTKFY